MQCSIDAFEFMDLRKRRLLLSLEEIRATMTGDAVSVRDLLSDQNGSYDARCARELCEQLVDLIDVSQKSTWALYGAYGPEALAWDDDQRTELARIASWAARLEGADDLDAMAALDLREAPTTFSADQRELVEALVWCAMHVCSCAALGRTTVGALRDVVGQTARLMAGPPSREGGGQRPLTHEGLLERELEHDSVWGLASGFNERRSAEGDLFDLMDALYEALTGKSATMLEADEVRQAYQASERGTTFGEAYEENVELYDTLNHMAWGEESLRLLAGVDVATWRSLGPGADVDAALAGLESCPDDVLDRVPALVTGDVTDVISYLIGWDQVGDTWDGMSRASRLGVLRRDLAGIREERAVEGEAMARVREGLLGEAQGLHDGIARWAEWLGDVDELFERYRLLRSSLRGEDALAGLGFGGADEVSLPQGAAGVHMSLEGLSAPASFGELFDQALDMLLAQRGLSFCADDKVFHRTFAYLDETRYQMSRLIEEE